VKDGEELYNSGDLDELKSYCYDFNYEDKTDSDLNVSNAAPGFKQYK